MAVGDIIVAHRVGSFQPAAGVEIMVTMVFTDNILSSCGIKQSSDSTTMKNYGGASNTNNSIWTTVAPKMGITNSHYFFNSSTSNGGITGIQIK